VKRIIIAGIALALTSTSLAEDTRRLNADVLWEMQRVGAPVISPDGRRAIVPVTRYPDDSDEPESRLWLLDVGGQPGQRALTAEGGKASEPVFSPDGRFLAFVSQRNDDEAGQIYVLPMDGPGEAVSVTDVPTGASGLKWVGEHLYFISRVWPGKTFEEMAEAIKAEQDSKVSAKVWTGMPYAFFDTWLDEARENHLFRVAGAGAEVEPLTLDTGYQLSRASPDAGDYDVSPDEQRIAFTANSRKEGVYPNYDVFVLERGTGKLKNITPDNAASDGRPRFSPDGRSLAYVSQSIEGFYGDQARLTVYDLRTSRARPLHTDWDRSADGLVWTPDSGGFYGAIDDAGTRRVYYLPLDGRAPRPITGKTDYDQLSIAANGTLLGRNQSFVYPPRVVRIDTASGSARRLDTFNDELMSGIEMGSYESVTYKGADGADIQMWVQYPPGFDANSKYPLFLLIHGGPHGAITDNFHFRWNAQTFSSWGYVTAWPNFHGSSGFGQALTDSVNPDWLTLPYADIIASADWLMDRPWIDKERMVAGGGSYGGYLSSILLGRDHPFNALVIHAAVYDMYAQSSADFAVHDQRFGPYWENPEIYQSISPHYFADKFETPSLVIHGQRDLRVPVGQGFELFRALQTRGVESRLVYYPDENHWVLKRGNSLHWYGEVRNWVERYAAPGPAAD